MERDSGNWRRAAGGGHVVGHSFAADRREAIRADFRGRAEKSWTVGRDGGDHPQGSGGARRDKNLPTMLQYRTHIKEKSLYNTPPTFAVYIVGLVLDWIEAEGGADGNREDERCQGEAALRRDRCERRLLQLPGREGIAVEDECGVPRGRRRRGHREEVRQGRPKRRG